MKSGSDGVTTVDHVKAFRPIGEFTLDFAKAMLRTGYYAPDHPQAKQSLAGLYEEFLRVLGHRSGLTYLVGHDEDRRTVMIDGYVPGPLALDKIMIRGMADLFTPKLLEFFDRRHLLSFSLRSALMADEFNAFVLLMSEPPRPGQAAEERDRVTQAFLDQHIVHVSTVFESDVVGRERELPWRVELALSRLGRDLSMLPLYKHASRDKIQEIKLQIIDDVIRPLHTPQLVKDLILNCDVLARDVAVLRETQIEHEIIAQIPAELLISTTWQVLESLRNLEMAGGDVHELALRHRVTVRDILNDLLRANVEVDGKLLEATISQDVFTSEELPASLQKKLKQHRVVEVFLTQSEDYLRALGQFPASKHGKQLAAITRLAFPELLHRGNYMEAGGILEALASGGHESEAAETVQELTESFHHAVATEENVERLLENLSDEDLDRSGRDALVVLLSCCGAAAIAGLQEIYAVTESRAIRASAFDAMKRIGLPALLPFLTGLSDMEHEWSAIHHILASLDDQTDPALAEPIKPFLQHENAHVRQAALTRVFGLLGPASEDCLIRALDDPDVVTRHTAVAYVGKLQSRDPKVLAFYGAALHPENPAHVEPEQEEVLTEICRSIAGLADVSFPDGSRVEEILLDALRLETKRRISGILHKRPPFHSERVRVAICEALGTVGTTATADALCDLASGESGDVEEAARAAAAQIQHRECR